MNTSVWSRDTGDTSEINQVTQADADNDHSELGQCDSLVACHVLIAKDSEDIFFQTHSKSNCRHVHVT